MDKHLCLVYNHFFFLFFFFKGIHFPGSRDRTLVVVFTDPVLVSLTKILISASLLTAIEILHNHRLAISARSGVAHLLAGTLL